MPLMLVFPTNSANKHGNHTEIAFKKFELQPNNQSGCPFMSNFKRKEKHTTALCQNIKQRVVVYTAYLKSLGSVSLLSNGS